jgi:hypothetical protein
VHRSNAVRRIVCFLDVSSLNLAVPSGTAIFSRDPAIIHKLTSIGYDLASGGAMSIAALREIMATGRGRWGGVDGPALRLGETRPGRLAWRVGSDGAQPPILETNGAALAVFAGDALYVEPPTGLMGPLHLGLPAGLLRTVLRSPPVPPESAERVGAELACRLPGIAPRRRFRKPRPGASPARPFRA